MGEEYHRDAEVRRVGTSGAFFHAVPAFHFVLKCEKRSKPTGQARISFLGLCGFLRFGTEPDIYIQRTIDQQASKLTPLQVSEKETGCNFIDPRLKKTGWNVRDHTQVRREISVAGFDGSLAEGISTSASTAPMAKSPLSSRPIAQARIRASATSTNSCNRKQNRFEKT